MNKKSKYYHLKNEIKQAMWKVFCKHEKELLKNNYELKDSQKEERCFILGNGPSLNEYDLSLLKKERVFVVNEFVRYEKLQDVCPDYYVIADPKFFDLNENDLLDRQFIDKINDLKKINKSIKLFVPTFCENNIKNYGWINNIDTYYFQGDLYCYKGYSEEIRLDKMIPAMQAVVQYAILIAIYMGYKEIYLLGTDQTNIIGNIKAYISESEASEYAFQLSDEQKRWKNSKLTSYTLPETLRGYARIFELYDELNEYCEKKAVRIFNCSPNTLIQNIPKIDYKELF